MLVTFIIIARNAGDKIDSLFVDLVNQDYPKKSIELILVDSDSKDDTKERMMRFYKENEYIYNNIMILDNPKITLPAGWNVALSQAHGEVILRVDAHSSIPNDFISKNVELIKSGEAITGGHRISIIENDSNLQKTLLAAETSLFGSGFASYRRGCSGDKLYVDSLAHAAYKTDVFIKVGGYDERLRRTEDNEMHYRMRKAGYKFCCSSDIKSYHHARSSVWQMIKQKYLNGLWIGRTIGICPQCFSLFHFIPLVFVCMIIFTAGLAAVGFAFPAIAMWLLYIVLTVIMTAMAMKKDGFVVTHLMLPLLFLLLHLAYGIGTLAGIFSLPFWLLENKSKPVTNIDRVSKLLAINRKREEEWNKTC